MAHCQAIRILAVSGPAALHHRLWKNIVSSSYAETNKLGGELAALSLHSSSKWRNIYRAVISCKPERSRKYQPNRHPLYFAASHACRAARGFEAHQQDKCSAALASFCQALSPAAKNAFFKIARELEQISNQNRGRTAFCRKMPPAS